MAKILSTINLGIVKIERDLIPVPRDDYLLESEVRTPLRGRLFGWMYTSNAWLIISAVYLAIALQDALERQDVILRVAFVTSIYWNFWASNNLHNGDLAERVATRATELASYRHDQLSISCILLTSYLLWGKRLFFEGYSADGIYVSAICTLLVFLTQLFWLTPSIVDLAEEQFSKTWRAGSTFTKRVLAVQYTMMVVLVKTALESQTPRLHLKVAGIVWFVYLPGMICFAMKTKRPNPVPRFGVHEMFHWFTVAGHLTTMVLDCTLY